MSKAYQDPRYTSGLQKFDDRRRAGDQLKALKNAQAQNTDVTTLVTQVQVLQDSTSGLVPAQRTINGKALTSNITLTAADIGLGNVTNDAQVRRDERGAAFGVATLDNNGKLVGSQQCNVGATSARPVAPSAGQMYLDTTINKPIWYTGTAWIDAAGTTV